MLATLSLSRFPYFSQLTLSDQLLFVIGMVTYFEVAERLGVAAILFEKQTHECKPNRMNFVVKFV